MPRRRKHAWLRSATTKHRRPGPRQSQASCVLRTPKDIDSEVHTSKEDAVWHTGSIQTTHKWGFSKGQRKQAWGVAQAGSHPVALPSFHRAAGVGLFGTHGHRHLLCCYHTMPYRGGSEAWLCATFQPQRQDRVKLHPCNSAQHLRKQGAGLFTRLLCSDSGLALPVRCAFGAITCNIKHEQSTSELCRKRQRSRVVERNPTPTPLHSAKTPTRSGTKCWRHVFQSLPPLDS